MSDWWRVGEIEVCGPYRDPRTGRVTALSARQQQVWAESVGGRLPTVEEWDAVVHSACVVVEPRPRDVATAPLDALDSDVMAAIHERGEDTIRIVAGKTWVQHSQSSGARATNYGWHVPPSEVDRARQTWRGIRVYPDTRGGYVIQPPAQAHSWSHVDYSQLGYAVRTPQGTETAPDDVDTDPGPTPTTAGERGAHVRAWQQWLTAWWLSRGERALPRYGADGHHGRETEDWTTRWRDATEVVEVVDLEPAARAISFRQAVSYYPGRREGPPIWVVIHTAEALEHSRTAENLQSWAASGPIGVSWHYAVDDDTVCQSVREEHTAWAAPGANARGIQIELAGYARQTAQEWADAFSSAQLELCAELVARICRRWEIPAVKVGPIEMADGLPGICGHLDVTRGVGVGRTTHGDPGPYFPWARFVGRVRELL